METRPPKKHGCLKIGAIFSVVVLIGLGILIMVYRAGAVDRGLVGASAAMNKKLPGYIDANTRLDSTSVGPGHVLHFHCTVLLWAPELLNQSVDVFKANMREGLVEKARSNPAFQTFSRDGVSVEYDYSDQSGTPIAQVLLTPDDFK